MSVPALAMQDQLPAPMPMPGVSAILESISGGGSLRRACSDNGQTPQSFLRLVVADTEIAERYAHARMSQAAVHADEIISIADDPELDPNDKRVRVDARKWVAARLHPKQWGDKQAVEVTGKDGAPLIQNLDADAVIDGLVALATEHPIAALPLRALLQKALDRIPIPG